MTSQYDFLAAISEMTTQAPVRRFYEETTFFAALGDVSNRSVLDVACGTGIYTRRLRQRGATRAVGIDSSEGMVDYARHLETSSPLGLEYHVMDAAQAKGLGTFDIVTATYLLHYAASRKAMAEMCAALYASLAPGGRLVSICMSPDAELTRSDYYRKYGFELSSPGGEGDTVTMSLLIPDMPISIEAFHWKRATYEQALRSAGFRDIVWQAPQVSPEGLTQLGADYWADYLRRPHAEVFSCRR